MRLLNRFWGNIEVNKPEACWNWTRSKNNKGYGVVWFRGRMQLAHRVMWQLAFGEIGKLNVLHKCDNRLCCNPNHLWLGTIKDNALDMVAKGRSPMGGAKITIEVAREIRSKAALGERQCNLSREYRLSTGALCRIVNNERWVEKGGING